MRTQVLAPTHAHQPLTLSAILLRLEGLAICSAALALYFTQGFSWLALVVFLLVPDLGALGYLVSARAGNISYNLAHTLLFPLGLALLAGFVENQLGLQIALIWLAHIGMDRAVGYGFKDGDTPISAARARR